MPEHSTRREFLQLSAACFGAGAFTRAFNNKKYDPLLSFTTLGCPDWDFSTITDFAASHGYKGIELRGLLRQLDLTLCPEFKTKEARKKSISIMKEKGLKFINLGSSANLHFANPETRKKNLDEARRFIDLAGQLNCPYIRVYPNNFPKEQEKNFTIELIGSGFAELGKYGNEKGVRVLMETHGEAVYTTDLENIMQVASHSNIGLVWDICNMWSVTKESPAYMYQRLKKYIFHTHIKDARLKDGKPQYVFLGQGEVPVFEAVDLLIKDRYPGYFSFEWEKLWHPELAGPELALADYPLAIKKWLEKK
jgi:sugar phosphate isomerase/epimerase